MQCDILSGGISVLHTGNILIADSYWNAHDDLRARTSNWDGWSGWMCTQFDRLLSGGGGGGGGLKNVKPFYRI